MVSEQEILSVCLGWRLLHCVSVSTFSPSSSFFFFFFSRVFSPQVATVHVRYMNSSRNFWPVFREQYIRALFTDSQISFFINFFIKNGSHGTIYTFKNYFTTVISVINFQFQQNKSYPNRPIYVLACVAVVVLFFANLVVSFCLLLWHFYFL